MHTFPLAPQACDAGAGDRCCQASQNGAGRSRMATRNLTFQLPSPRDIFCAEVPSFLSHSCRSDRIQFHPSEIVIEFAASLPYRI